jgi:SAM-dependent methyltransferase
MNQDDNGWDQSAAAWIAEQGDRGDWARQNILDPVMLERVLARPFKRALDVGCGEGRFCRMLQAHQIAAVGIDPTEALLDLARARDPAGRYELARGEALPFADGSFDLVVSYLTLIDIDDFRAAIGEMVRVLEAGGTLLIANLTSFITANEGGWISDAAGRRLHYPIDRYLEEFPEWLEWSGIRIKNWHRPLSSYMRELIGHGLMLTFFDEPPARSGDLDRQALQRRVPWFMVMEWRRPNAEA